jgi:hypothetical protein
MLVTLLLKSKSCSANSEVEISGLSVEKKVYYLNGKYFVVLDDRIINYWNINEDDDIWVQQTPSDDGISMELLRKCPKKAVQFY